MSLQAGTRVGAFVIQAPIGAGGMGEVYLAEDPRLRRRVALKVLPPHLATDEAAGQRLLREARAAATLDHPNICTVYEVGEADGRGFIAMQYVDGDTLAQRLKQSPDALTVWRKLPAARLHERPTSSPGLDESTYIVNKLDVRRNLFRVALSR